MVVNDESTWPPELLERIAAERDVFLDHELRRTRSPPKTEFNPRRWDRLHEDLSDFVAPYSLRGYHCTRLTKEEIAWIIEHGMTLPNESTLRSRIIVLEKSGKLSSEIARCLLENNAARMPFRKDRIWFCFYPPRFAWQEGIERFFRSWGGEALYNHHESDPVTGVVLNRIGTPCVIEAEVPVASIDFRYGLTELLGRQYLVNRGLKTSEEIHYEHFIVKPLSASSVIRIVRFPDRDFELLTDCSSWDPPLLG